MIKNNKWILIKCIWILLSGAVFFKKAECQGLQFETKLSWREVLAKAKLENKYIFIDCYATWCGPCKAMDKDVYITKEVGKAYNDQFVSVKLQMDKTDKDDSTTKSWYWIANDICRKYAITAFPTYLFLSPDGNPLHKAIGYRKVSDFVALKEDALNPGKQFYSILEKYQPSKMDTAELKALALLAKEMGKEEESGKIAADYLRQMPKKLFEDSLMYEFIKNFKNNTAVSSVIEAYLKSLTKRDIYKTENLRLLANLPVNSFSTEVFQNYIATLTDDELLLKSNLKMFSKLLQIIKTGDRVFNLYYFQAANVIQGMNSDSSYPKRVVDMILFLNEIEPIARESELLNSDINWINVQKSIEKKTDSITAARVVANQKVWWYEKITTKARKEKRIDDEQRFGRLWAQSLAEKIDKESISSIATWNMIEYAIYRYCYDLRILEKSLVYSSQMFKDGFAPGIGYSYVYAGLLYKMGKTEGAISWQKMMVDLLKGSWNLKKGDISNNRFYTRQLEILQGMKENKPFSTLIYWGDEN